jgi:hypothetical protein
MNPAKPRERKCATCRFYEPSPLWRKGWCRNPLLFDPQTNHLVEADSLSCSRTFIDYWEAREPGRVGRPQDSSDGPQPVRRAPSIPMPATGPGGAPLRGGALTVAAAQAAAQPRERPPQLSLVKPTAAPDPAAPRQDTVPLAIVGAPNAQPTEQIATAPPQVEPQAPVEEESLQGTTLRTALGAAVLIALLVAAVVFLMRPGGAPPAATPTVPVAAIAPPIPTNTPPPPPSPTAAPTVAPPTPAPLVLAIGAKAQITGLNGAGLNVRSAPGTKARILGRLTEGVTAQIVAGPQNADGVAWWQVTGWDTKGTPGWASAKYLKAVR